MGFHYCFPGVRPLDCVFFGSVIREWWEIEFNLPSLLCGGDKTVWALLCCSNVELFTQRCNCLCQPILHFTINHTTWDSFVWRAYQTVTQICQGLQLINIKDESRSLYGTRRKQSLFVFENALRACLFLYCLLWNVIKSTTKLNYQFHIGTRQSFFVEEVSTIGRPHQESFRYLCTFAIVDQLSWQEQFQGEK